MHQIKTRGFLRRVEGRVEGASTADLANAMSARGYRAVVVGMDWSLLQRGIALVVEGIRR